MKTHKYLFLFALFFFQSSMLCFSQIIFSKGYIVKNDGSKISCLIKNNDWLENPTKIQYRLNEGGSVTTAGIDSLKEFGVDDYSRYVRAKVKIDRSRVKIISLLEDKQPEWSEETLFLKELVCGKAGLWEYVGTERNWYFYSIDNSFPEQLVYKLYKKEGNLLENVTFKQQLIAYLQNENTKKIDLTKMRYDKSSMLEYFKLYNTKYEYCAYVDFIKPDREVLNIKAVGSINYSSMSIQNSALDSKPFDFGSKFNWMAGIELEYFLSFNRNIWSVILTPIYEQVYNTKTEEYKLGNIVISSNTRTFDIKSIEFPIGVRYSKYLPNNSRLYFNVLYNTALGVHFKRYFNYNIYDSIKQRAAANFILGLGYSISDLSFEIKYHTNQELLNAVSSWKTDYPKISLSVSYKLFKLTGK